MKIKRISKKRESGFTIIETVLSIAIFVMIALALFNMFNTILRTIRNNKATLNANSVAIEQMEIMRGMKFENVGTEEGFLPAGPLPNEKTLMRGGTTFTVLTDITWVDDAYDGTGVDDSFPYDYKKARVRVRWMNPITGGTEEMSTSTDIVPAGLEGLTEGRGGIYVTAFDAQGIVIHEARVTISSELAGYGPVTGETDLNGNLWVPDLVPASDYHIVVTKDGFSTAQTYAINNDVSSPDYNPIPEKTDANVAVQSVVKMGFAIDILGNLNIKTMHFANPANWIVNAGTAGEQTENAIALDASGNLFVAFADTRETESYIYLQKFNYSSSTGTYSRAWGSDVKAVGQVGSAGPELEFTSDGSLMMAWSDRRNGNGDIYMQEFSAANGNPVGSEFVVSHDAGGSAQTNVSMDSDQDGNVYLAWEDYRDSDWNIYSQKFTVATASFWADDFRINVSTAAEQLAPKVVTDRDTDAGGGNLNNLYVFYQSNHSGNFDVIMSKFDKDRTVLMAEKVVNTDGSSLGQYQPDAAYDGTGNFYVVWADERSSQPDIYLQKVDKSGTQSYAGDIRVNDDSFPTAWRLKPAVAYLSDGEIYIAWEDNRNGDMYSSIYASKIDSNASRLWTYDLIVTDNIYSLESDAAIVCDAGGKAVTVWQDNRNGTNDIYAARYSDMGNLQRAGVEVTVVSEKAKGKYPNPDYPLLSGNEYIMIPKYRQVFTSDANGDVHITGIEWGSYNFTAASPYSITSFDLPAPIAVAPGGTSSIVINVAP